MGFWLPPQVMGWPSACSGGAGDIPPATHLPFLGKNRRASCGGRKGRNPGQVQAADPRGRAHGPQPSPSTRSAHHVSEQMNPQIAARLPAFLGASGCANPWALAGTKQGPPCQHSAGQTRSVQEKSPNKRRLVLKEPKHKTLDANTRNFQETRCK